jgi:hypothetical protein
MIGPGFGATLGAGLRIFFRQPLESTSLFEAPMPSLFHLELPSVESVKTVVVTGRAFYRWLSPKVSRMADEFDVEAMIERFRARARAVRQRSLPPVEGPERKRFVDQARIDYQDYAIIGDAQGRIEDGVLTLTVDLRPKPDSAG